MVRPLIVTPEIEARGEHWQMDVRAKRAPWMDIRAYGAVGDGVTDDTDAIQRAIDERDLMGGVSLVAPAGRYRITRPLIVSGRLSLVGEIGTRYPHTDDATWPTMFLCNEIDGYLFSLGGEADRVTIDGIKFWGSSAAPEASAAARLAGASTTWRGLLECTSAGTGAYAVFLRRVGVAYGLTAYAAIDFSKVFWSRIEDSYISHFPNGMGFRSSQTGAYMTTLDLRKTYVTYCRQGFYVQGVTSLAFSECVVESCVVVGAARNVAVSWDRCHFERIGYCVLATHTAGITIQGMGLVDATLPDPVEAAFTALYMSMTFRNCIFQSRHSARRWFQGVGVGTAYGSNGRAVFEQCLYNDDSDTMGDFFSEAGRIRYAYSWYGNLVNKNWDLIYADARRITDGILRIAFPAAVYDRRVQVNNGRFVYLPDADGTGFTTRPTVAPTDGQNEVGDRVVLNTPEAEGNTGYTCVTAGDPGQWLGDQSQPRGRRSYSYGGAAADWIMTAEDANHSFFYLSGASGAVNAIFPAVRPGILFVVQNATGHTVTVKVGAGAGATVTNTKRAILSMTASDCVKLYEEP